MGQSKRVLSAIKEDQSQQESIFKDTSKIHPIFKEILESYGIDKIKLLTTKSKQNETRNI